MPKYDTFFIGPYDSGLIENRRPWMIPDEAFSVLKNAYVFRDRVRKRWGTELINPDGLDNAQISSRLRINTGEMTDAMGDKIAGTAPGLIEKGQIFSVGTEIFTVNESGIAVAMLSTGAGGGAVSTGTTSYTITGATPNTAIYWYPALPVMGIIQYENDDVNKETTIVFDTRYGYQYAGSGYEQTPGATWKGTETDFFWGAMYRGAVENAQILFVSNFYVVDYGAGDYDPIRYWNGTTWADYVRKYSAAANTEIVSARIILQFKNRLILLNTWEQPGDSATPQNFRNRCRFSQNGSPFAPEAFYQPATVSGTPGVYGRGDKIDAPTNEAIVGAEFLRDRLMVYFERSTWELVYTGNQVLPFVWQKINTELGAESTFSVVPFDKVVLGIGDVGIHACTGTNVNRIDEHIPEEIFQIHNTEGGTKRVCGIRDYDAQFVYWSYPQISEAVNPTWPTRILSYNYTNGSWAYFDDSITAFGYWQANFSLTWANSTATWESLSNSWQSGALQSQYRAIIAGNQQGFVMRVRRDETRNAPSLQITDVMVSGDIVTLTVLNHNLEPSSYIHIENVTGLTGLDGIYEVGPFIDADTIQVVQTGTSGTYSGGGTIARVSQIDIRTKPYNFYANKGVNISINKVNFNVQRTASGAITVDYSPSFSTLSLVQGGQVTNTAVGSNVLTTAPYTDVPIEAEQTQLWHPIYFYGQGETISFRLWMTPEQMLDENVVNNDFQLHGMLIYAQPGSMRLQ